MELEVRTRQSTVDEAVATDGQDVISRKRAAAEVEEMQNHRRVEKEGEVLEPLLSDIVCIRIRGQVLSLQNIQEIYENSKNIQLNYK